MLIKEALKWGHKQLILTSESARLDAEVLLSHVLKRPVTFLLAHDEHKICTISLWKYRWLIQKRKKGIPVAYSTKHKEFFFLDFFVNRHVLVPRPDTEILAECVINYIQGSRIQDPGFSPIILDVGTGSGCIPISVLKNADGIKAVATDISRKALRVARMNVKKHKLGSRITLIHSDLLENVPAYLFGRREVILTANLPYIPADFQVSPELKYEPQISLYGGKDGMDLYKKIVQQLKSIRPKAIFFELFEHQIAILKNRMSDYRLKYVKDMSGKARVLVMERL